MSECEHEMIWVGSYTNLRCAKCNESYTAIQAEKVAQLEQALDMEAARGAEVLAENAKMRELMRAVVDASRNTTYPDGNPLLLALDAIAALVKGEN